jgi:hypothetical protein
MAWNLWQTVNAGEPEPALSPKLIPAE